MTKASSRFLREAGLCARFKLIFRFCGGRKRLSGRKLSSRKLSVERDDCSERSVLGVLGLGGKAASSAVQRLTGAKQRLRRERPLR